MTDEPAKSTTHAALNCARENGCTISYDPNLRPALWKSLDEAKKQIRSVMGFADILKISEEELEFITDEKDMETGTRILYTEFGISLILVTRGSEGSFYRLGEITGAKPTFSNIKAIDTTGAGDSFLGGFLYCMLAHGIKDPRNLDKNTIEQIIIFANAVASLCVTKKGAIPAMPDLTSVMKLLAAK